MQGLIGPLKELAEFEEQRCGNDPCVRMCEFPEISYDVCTWRWL